MTNAAWSALLQECEERLLESQRAHADSLALVRRAAVMSEVPGAGLNEHALVALLEMHRDELLTALRSESARHGEAPVAAAEFMPILVYHEEDASYRMGRRKVALTETERQILDQLRAMMPEPASRRRLHEHLYPSAEKATLGAIDVYLSNLRQKLKLAGNGQEFIQSVRGQGWALNPSLYATSKVQTLTRS